MKTVHICETCNTQYTHRPDAVACEAQVPRGIADGGLQDTDTAEVGDLVSCGGHYSWWDGSSRWRFKMGATHKFYKFAHRGSEHSFLFHPLWVVVDKVADKDHRMSYILASASNCAGEPQVANTGCDHRHLVNHGVASAERLRAVMNLYAKGARVSIV